MIISNNALKYFDKLPSDLIIRINVAWCHSVEQLLTIIHNSTHPIYLDYPTGRTKPPVPTIALEDAIKIANDNYRVKYFAFSNAEDPDKVKELRKKVDNRIQLVPKIETTLGVLNMEVICDAAQTNMVMLDHEDLYVNVNCDSKRFNEYMDTTFEKGKLNNIRVFKVQGIIFDETK